MSQIYGVLVRGGCTVTIQSLEKLIAKKRAIKTATMQQLLTGKKRLPGFDRHPNGELKGYKQAELGEVPEDWEVVELSKFVAALSAGISVNSADESALQYAHDESVLKTSCISGGYFDPSECKKIIPKDIVRAKLNPVQGAIIISRMNTPLLVGECGYVDKTYQNLFLPDRLWQTSFKKDAALDSRWLAYLLSFGIVSKAIKETATGTSGSMKNIAKNKLLSVTIPAPSVEEQTAIAAVLADMDKDIEALEKRLGKTQQVKQGMMQELLTGRTRLV